MSFSRLRAAIAEHMLVLAFIAAVVPLVVLLALQFMWLRELDSASRVSHRATLKTWLETVGSEVEHFYRSTGERLLNVPASLFAKGDLSPIAEYWKKRPQEGVRRLFAADFTYEQYGNFYVYEPERGQLVSSAASDESLAIILATLPYQRWARGVSGSETSTLQAVESDPDHRIILRPVVGEGSTIVGVVGFVIDAEYVKKELLPKITAATKPEGEAALHFAARDESGALAFGSLPENGAPIAAHLPFVFKDWSLAVVSDGGKRNQLGANLTIGFVTACILLGAVALAFLIANRSMKLSQMKSDFVSNVSHELRTPLASIRLFAELLKAGRAGTPEKVKEYGDYIETESRRLSRLIENILDFSRIESKKKRYVQRPCDVVELVRTVLTVFEVRIEQAGMKLHVEMPCDPELTANLDQDAVSQALHNLLDNAIKYSPTGQEIRVRVAPEAGRVVISVQDKGIGIAKSDQARVFERFHRVGTGLVHDVKGSGLGLSIVDHIAKAHGGEVTVESELGRGSTFSLRLPIERRDHAAAVDRRG